LAVLGTVLGNVFANRLETSFIGFGIPQEQAATMAAAAASESGGGGGSSAQKAGIPEQVQQQIEAAVAADFAVATQAVLIGMAIVLLVSLLISFAHPGGRVEHETVELDDAPAQTKDPA
jgi:hypothetical protein